MTNWSWRRRQVAAPTRRAAGAVRTFGVLALLATALTVSVGVGAPLAAYADTETIGNTWSLASTGWVTTWWCEYSDATGEGCYWYYSDVDAGGGLEWEQWRDTSGNYYVRMVEDTWFGTIGGEPGLSQYPNEANIVPSAEVSTHWEGSTQISSAHPNPSLGCPWPAEPVYEPCALSTYNGNGYHFYAPWYDDPADFYVSNDGYLPASPDGSLYQAEVATPSF